jgi:ubiquinone/menaquinone biosynthesis C-methylase UbiE
MLQSNLRQKPTYILGHSGEELNRLISQARFFGDLTAQVLLSAGLCEGMRVLDVGCGVGDVSFLAASIVGPEGRVLGVDKSPEAISLASQRATTAGLTNVQFLTQDLSNLVLDEPVDALIGRLVLMYFADPAVTLRRLTTFLKPGGVIAFHEMDMEGAKSEPTCELFETAVQRIRQTFTHAGADTRTGLKLRRIFQEAGLPAPHLSLSARVEGGPDSPGYEVVAQTLRSVLPMMERFGVAKPEEVAIETLAQRLRDEVTACNGVIVLPHLIGAWTRKPL